MDKRLRKFMISLLFYGPVFLHAWEIPVSAERRPDQNWKQALGSQVALSDLHYILHLDLTTTDMKGISIVGPNALPQWTLGLRSLHDLTALSYGVRAYKNPNTGHFLRKAPWLYPVDGCYAKAAHVSSQVQKHGYAKPGKVFAYGDLEFRSPYARNKRVTYWSYHVAAAYNVGPEVYVIDPMINSQNAIVLSDWLNQISKKPQKVKVRLCDANAYSPSSRCQGGRGQGAYLGHMTGVLKQEWTHLQKLGYQPLQLLAP